MGKLKWRTTQRTAITHRGVYVADVSQDRSYAYAYLRQHDGVWLYVSAGETLDAVSDRCAEHAAEQPAHPPMAGWPADAELVHG